MARKRTPVGAPPGTLMNFDPAASPFNMPELSWRFGYPAALAIMAAVAVGLLWVFRRRRWL